ncbi:hypothetical protein ABW09_24465 [Pluralibacter gergoviae]|uniref:hypothetical protein n=1 Tax=Pluralibacter gergoviae TaxID=61647 RepID=UPI00065227C0|nr:hypothetical protein [Pluralibacter gergoviae]KMK12495.1 hypothetical protein ABW09_24465 [Pluralibacter gergoviae]
MDKSSIENLIFAIEKGKVRGFDELKEVNGESYFFQYALKMRNGLYNTYFFYVPESKMDVIEDYAAEEIKEFRTITDAFNYFKLLGVNVENFSAIKGTLPF